jgi:hypothetical protein
VNAGSKSRVVFNLTWGTTDVLGYFIGNIYISVWHEGVMRSRRSCPALLTADSFDPVLRWVNHTMFWMRFVTGCNRTHLHVLANCTIR